MHSDNFREELLRRYVVKRLISAVTVPVSSGTYEVSFAAHKSADDPQNRFDDSTRVKPPVGPGDDGWPDLSSFVDKPCGFRPVVSPITEPAAGHRVWGRPHLISEPAGWIEAGFGRPTITFVEEAWAPGDIAICIQLGSIWMWK